MNIINSFFKNINYIQFLIVYFNKNIVLLCGENYFVFYKKLIISNNYLFNFNGIINFINLFYKNDIWIIDCDRSLIYNYIKRLIFKVNNKDSILLVLNNNNVKSLYNFLLENYNYKRIILIIDGIISISNIEFLFNEFLNKFTKKKLILISYTYKDKLYYDKIINKYINDKNEVNKLRILKDNNYIYKNKNYNNNFEITKNINIVNNIELCNKLLDINIYGQNSIIASIKKNVIETFDNFTIESNKPLGSFLLCGPSGTGKTEIVKVLSKSIYGASGKLLKFDMSEFMESHSISKLIGTPPGYVGYSEGSRFINLINKNKHSIILFDEIEKASKNIYNIMLQILDDGVLTSSSGEKGIFKHSFIFFTSNLGQKESYNITNNEKLYVKTIKKFVENYFSPEFLNRISDILVFKYQNFNYLIKTLYKFTLEFEYIYNTNFVFSNIIKKIIYNLLSNKIYGARILNRQSYKFISNSVEILRYININNRFMQLNNNINKFNIYSFDKNKNNNNGFFIKNNNIIL